MAGKLVWDGKEPVVVGYRSTFQPMFRPVGSLVGPPSPYTVPAEWLASQVGTQLPFAYGLTDDPHSRSLNAVEEPNG